MVFYFWFFIIKLKSKGKILTESLRLNLSIDEKDNKNDSDSNIVNLVRESSLPAATKNTFTMNSAEVGKSELPRN